VGITAGFQPRAPDLSGRPQCALPDSDRELQISVCIAGSRLQAPDLSVHCRASTASSRSQWALHAGPQPRAPDLSAHCRTSTVSSGSQTSTAGIAAGFHPRAPDLSGRSQWALPDFNRELQISVGTACRTSTASSRSQWALPDFNRKRQISVC